MNAVDVPSSRPTHPGCVRARRCEKGSGSVMSEVVRDYSLRFYVWAYHFFKQNLIPVKRILWKVSLGASNHLKSSTICEPYVSNPLLWQQIASSSPPFLGSLCCSPFVLLGCSSFEVNLLTLFQSRSGEKHRTVQFLCS